MDVDFEKRLIYINEPEKGSETGVYRVSEKCIKMLENLPRKGERIFSTLQSLRVNFTNQRARLAYKLGNPRFKQIHFHTFRHWRGTLEAYRVPNAFHVQKFLRQHPE